jgi:glycosyltransferase involved in cell wall biosynthesis
MDLRLPSAPVEIVTVQDVAPLRFPDEGSLPSRAVASLRRARAVLAPSDFAADDIADALGITRPTVIHHGVPSDAFKPHALDPSVIVRHGIDGPYLLHCGGVSLRKNLQGLHAAWSILRRWVEDVQLVLAGPADPRRTSLFAADDRVIMLGVVDRTTLLGLMTSAMAVVVPSLYEGFGFPAVEAMACGTAVVATNMASLPEICGDGALLCDVDPESMANAMLRVLDDRSLRDQLTLAGAERVRLLTWHMAAQRHLAVYQQCLEGV